MKFDFAPFFKRYEAISALAQNVFDQVSTNHASCVRCNRGCDDCCYALFDLTFIEAFYINHQFNRLFQGKNKLDQVEKANRIDRRIYKIKKNAFKELNSGKNEDSILLDMAKVRIRCPLLNDENLCDLYEYRPITCKLYGIPTAIRGEGYSCGKSGFSEGHEYPTVNLDPIQSELFKISSDLLSEIKSKHLRLAEMLIPISMAILTDFDTEYLGIDDHEEREKDDSKKSN